MLKKLRDMVSSHWFIRAGLYASLAGLAALTTVVILGCTNFDDPIVRNAWQEISHGWGPEMSVLYDRRNFDRLCFLMNLTFFADNFVEWVILPGLACGMLAWTLDVGSRVGEEGAVKEEHSSFVARGLILFLGCTSLIMFVWYGWRDFNLYRTRTLQQAIRSVFLCPIVYSVRHIKSGTTLGPKDLVLRMTEAHLIQQDARTSVTKLLGRVPKYDLDKDHQMEDCDLVPVYHY